jgi:hypothetical protein
MNHRTIAVWSAIACAAVLAAPSGARAHCDSLDGPVVKAAQRALETGDPSLVLMWVAAADEAEILAAFEQTRAVRGLDSRAQALADRYFFETVVRVHRAGEGAPFTGLKPAGLDLGPAIPAADRALAAGSPTLVIDLVTVALHHELKRHFDEVMEAKAWRAGDVAAGRRFVKAYVEYIHYVERLYEAINVPAHGHFPEAPPHVR